MDEEEIEEMAADPMDILHRAMAVLGRCRVEYCSSDDWIEYQKLAKAFERYKEFE